MRGHSYRKQEEEEHSDRKKSNWKDWKMVQRIGSDWH